MHQTGRIIVAAGLIQALSLGCSGDDDPATDVSSGSSGAGGKQATGGTTSTGGKQASGIGGATGGSVAAAGSGPGGATSGGGAAAIGGMLATGGTPDAAGGTTVTMAGAGGTFDGGSAGAAGVAVTPVAGAAGNPTTAGNAGSIATDIAGRAGAAGSVSTAGTAGTDVAGAAGIAGAEATAGSAGAAGVSGAETILLTDPVPGGSIANWTSPSAALNPTVTIAEVTSPFDGSTAIQTAAVGTTTASCETKKTWRMYSLPMEVRSNQVAFDLYLALDSDKTYYNWPGLEIVLFQGGTFVGYTLYYRGASLGDYFGGGDPTKSRDIVNNGYQRLTLDPLLDTSDQVSSGPILFDNFGIYLINYACVGVNSVTFDALSVVSLP